VNRRVLWILLLALLLALIVLVVRHDAGTVGPLRTGQFASVAFYLALAVFIGGMVFTIFRRQVTQALEAALLWGVIATLLAVGHTYRFELQQVGQRVLAEVMPGYAATRGRAVEISRGRAGEFSVQARVNGARIPMVLDTGASAVVLTYDAAKSAGLPLEVLNYTVRVDTANGKTHAAPVTLDRIAVGAIIERSVPALIAQPGQLRSSLLGMTFLDRLESWEVRGDRLMMRGYP
jgi:aspartyl protease family protein